MKFCAVRKMYVLSPFKNRYKNCTHSGYTVTYLAQCICTANAKWQTAAGEQLGEARPGLLCSATGFIMCLCFLKQAACLCEWFACIFLSGLLCGLVVLCYFCLFVYLQDSNMAQDKQYGKAVPPEQRKTWRRNCIVLFV